jgi:hypothetical protein
MRELAFKVSVDEANLILEDLGYLPFARVYALVEKVQQQAGEQLKDALQLGATPGSEVAAAHLSDTTNGGSHGR